MSERYWYQDGWVVLGIVFVVVFGWGVYRQSAEDSKPQVIPNIVGSMNHPLFGSPTLVITLWHDHTGVLRNGRLMVSVDGKQVEGRSGLDTQFHSFEVWQPNRENAVTLKFPIKNFDPTKEIPISYSLIGHGIKPFRYSNAWLGDTWKSNQRSSP